MRTHTVVLICILGLSSRAAIASNSHCTSSEDVVWSCSANKKVFSVCASKGLGKDTGYMQYRAGPAGKPDFLFPKTHRHPVGLFTSRLLARAASLSFQNGQHVYTVVDPLMGEAQIEVFKDAKFIATIECGQSTHTLTDTTTLNLFKSIGISE